MDPGDKNNSKRGKLSKMDSGDCPTSTMISLSHTANHLDNKFAKMNELISSIEKYIETRAEDEAIKINQHLLALSLSMDLYIFDPHTNIASKFFISIYNLMHSLEPRSLTSWYCIDVLLNACKNSAARQALKETYQFLPCLARMVGDPHTMEKNLRLLRLILCITCGIKIHWQIPHMAHLMSILCKWIERNEPEVVCLALGILVNLCNKNVLSVYVLQQTVDLKNLIRMCLANAKGPIIEVYVCQLSIALESVNGYIPAVMFPVLIEKTFTAVVEASKKRDSIMLKQIIDFFMESVRNNHYNFTGHNSKECIENIMQLINSKNGTFKDPECLSIILDFINFLIEMKVPQISSLFPEIIALALTWIQESTVSFNALTLLKTIAINTDKRNEKQLESLVGSLKVFLLILNSCREDKTLLNNTHYIKRLSALLQLLTALVQVKSISSKIRTELNEEMFTNVLFPVLGDNNSPSRSREIISSTDAINLYIYTLALVAKLAESNNNWQIFRKGLSDNSQIHMIIAQALCGSPRDVKKIALELSSSCSDGVACAMGNPQLTNTGNETNGTMSSSPLNDMSFGLIPVCQKERLENILDVFERNISNNEVNIATSEVMELYTYKFSYLLQAERAALASLEAATKHCTQLQHGISRLNYEYRNLQWREMYNTQKVEQFSKKKDDLALELNQIRNMLAAEKGKHTVLKSEFVSKVKELEDLNEKYGKLQQLVDRLEENCKKREKKEEKQAKVIKEYEETINDKTHQIQQLKKSLEQEQITLTETRTALQAKTAILDSITRMANASVC